MYWNDRAYRAAILARQRFQKAAQRRHTQVAGIGIDVDESRPRGGLHDGSRGSDEGHRYGDDLVTRADAKRQQRDAQCIRPVGHGDDALHVQKIGELTLEAFDLMAANVGGGGMYRLQLARDALGDFQVLAGQIHEFNFHCDRLSFDTKAGSCRRAGKPATIAPAGTSRTTIAPAPTNAPAPISIPPITIAPLPIDAPLRTTVCSIFQSFSVCSPPSQPVARGQRTLMKMTPWPMKTSPSMVPPEHTNV